MSMELTTPHPLQACWDLQLAGLAADALRVALTIDLFEHLEQHTAPAQLAKTLDLEPFNTGYLLEMLWAQGLLERDEQGSHYRNGETARRHLVRSSGNYCGDALLFRHQVLRQAGQPLEQALRNGLPAAGAPSAEMARRWAEAARVQIAQEQQAVTVEVACALIERLPEAPGLQRMLDLGGGPGLVAIALARQLPDLHGTVFDFAETAAVAKENILRAGLEQRLGSMGGDLDQDDFGSGYDLIWCSSVLHFASDLDGLLQRLHGALNPGGVLVCCHAEVPEERQAAARVLPYYLHMRMQGRHVLPAGELAQKLRNVGFVDVEQQGGLRYPVAPVTAVVARKA
ncbi:methyltransferase [Pseudomonas xanthosomatis]|uniref:methyltransferase n=1 Tax=Pseudomonas xanthosomatis TaxID=2842356 RepID=UPI001C3E1C8F|nr:methyltransferase [Pseudomonas xanthosomatis]QXH47226.1 methyltransferase [Pseudomonas xanthosomatis]